MKTILLITAFICYQDTGTNVYKAKDIKTGVEGDFYTPLKLEKGDTIKLNN